MFVARRILRKNKQFTNFICTSNVLNCDKPKDKNEMENFIQSKNEKDEQKTVFSESEINKISDLHTQESLSRKSKYLNSRILFERVSKKSVKKVAEELGGNVKKTTEEILSYLNEMEISKDSSKEAKFSNKNYYNRIQRLPMHQKMTSREIYFSKPLNIFDPHIMNETESQVKLKIWEDLEAEELKYLTKKSPANCFEEMIVWTEEGKLWQFPIDNDQGMEKEAEISFTEHIFMEQYLEPWCPKKGPLRKFMELVLIGLSKNHFYTVEEKKEHIDWFRKYFEEKRKLLQRLGAMDSAKEPGEIGVSGTLAEKDA